MDIQLPQGGWLLQKFFPSPEHIWMLGEIETPEDLADVQVEFQLGYEDQLELIKWAGSNGILDFPEIPVAAHHVPYAYRAHVKWETGDLISVKKDFGNFWMVQKNGQVFHLVNNVPITESGIPEGVEWEMIIK